jgi:hypothetical protein
MAGWTTRVVLFAAALGAGCELLVPDSLPPYLCGPGSGTCPEGMTCGTSGQCGYPADVSTMPDASGMTDVVSEMMMIGDVTSEPQACRSLGCTCSGASDCDSQICADELTVGSGLYTAVGHGFCIQACCTSSDCPADFVCYASDAGGATLGGVSCGADANCRSGLCSTTCQDTCCSIYQAGECGGGACHVGTFPGRGFDTHLTPHCSTASSGSGTGNCSSDSTCKSDMCTAFTCVDTCRSSSDCGSNATCWYATDTTSDIFTTCTSGNGSTPLGGSCTATTDCRTALCDPNSSECTDTCFTNSDCAAMSGWFCRPEELQLEGGGSASVLLCGP